MISFREEFIKRYIERLTHKLEQELKERLPEKDYFANMVEQADGILREIVELKK